MKVTFDKFVSKFQPQKFKNRMTSARPSPSSESHSIERVDTYDESEACKPVFVLSPDTVHPDKLLVLRVNIVDRPTPLPLVCRAVVINFVALLVKKGHSERAVVI